MKGTVKFFNSEKDFGFITGEDDKDYFAHKTELAEGTRIAEGDSVEFEAAEGDRGLKATNITKN